MKEINKTKHAPVTKNSFIMIKNTQQTGIKGESTKWKKIEKNFLKQKKFRFIYQLTVLTRH